MSTLNLHNPASSAVSSRQTQKPQATRSRSTSILRSLWLPAVLMLAIAAGGLTGIVVAYELNYSQAAFEVASLATYRPSVITRVYADDGETVIGEFALERRVPLRHDEIPPLVRNAILAVEDVRFEQHIGIDPIRTVGAVFKNLRTGSREGGSTLTQQLARNMFLSREQTVTRKFNEWIVALQIERYYTKNQIMEMYVNHVYLGARAYGFEAAAETYFGKEAKDLTLEEAALLAGIPRAPSQLSPTVDIERARERRDLVLELMARNNFVSQAEADAAQARPIRLAQTAQYPMQQRSSVFDYPVEEIRRQIEERFTTRVAFGGLTVYSTINADAQRAAVQSIREGLHNYDRTHTRWRSNYDSIMTPPATTNGDGATSGGNNRTAPSQSTQPTPQQLANYIHPDWYGDDFEADEYARGLIMSVDATRNEANVRFGSYSATLGVRDMGWSGRQPRAEFRPGMLPQFRIKTVDEANRRLTVELVQIPEIQSALLTLNAQSGEIAAMVGGYDATTNKFNTATQALRQTGSCFKPFIYAAALEWGMGPNTLVSGAPIRRGNWQPHNYDGSTGNGDVPMRTALARSLNIPAVHLLDTVGIQTGAQMVRRFGITEPMAPYLPSALGATEVPLIEMVSAYSAFPNRGVRVEPHLIRRVLDRDGNVLEEWEQTTYRVTSEYVALTMVDMMRGVVEGGTATGARALGVQVAGKTGTVNDHTDVWFIGYTPTWVTGVWMGNPERKQPLGNDMTGGHGALPIFVDFMREFLRDRPRETFPRPPEMPEDIRELNLQRQREMAEERDSRALARDVRGGTLPVFAPEQPRLEQITLPPTVPENSPPSTSTTPAAGAAAERDRTEGGATTATPTRTPSATPPPPPAATRPREVEGPRRRGKKGDEETP